jgi:hypothetical protein
MLTGEGCVSLQHPRQAEVLVFDPRDRNCRNGPSYAA